ncbi:hypothetical protein T4B_545 [Trichinella pseudospiralis]|uniref:Secreted protein n=1 Tax=Trichinella pseudospiralis TaxID=6337 RepID=A0A0V1IYA8_TRIPS|nr:hypothetical protein T4B_545 [Trichinella pseudospiralis]
MQSSCRFIFTAEWLILSYSVLIINRSASVCNNDFYVTLLYMRRRVCNVSLYHLTIKTSIFGLKTAKVCSLLSCCIAVRDWLDRKLTIHINYPIDFALVLPSQLTTTLFTAADLPTFGCQSFHASKC